MIEQLVQLAHVLGSMALGAMIGWEREAAHKSAGLRTHMLMSGAATLLVVLGQRAATLYDQQLAPSALRVDPIGIIEAVITGVSFLGAGTVIRGGARRVQGLTTAASLLFTASIGVAAGVGAWMLAAGTTVLALVALRGFARFERRDLED